MTRSDQYVAVIFTSRRTADDEEGYAAESEHMERLAARQPGYRGIESARSTGGLGITVSYWDTEADARAWKRESEHLLAQRAGRTRWYESYRVRVATVTREYSYDRSHVSLPTGMSPTDPGASPMNEPDDVIHIALPDDWNAARATGEYRISTRGRTLDEEGFIHCSYPHQLESVANRFYPDLVELVLLHLDLDQIADEVRAEPSVEGDELFPHLYGPIPTSAIVAATWWDRGEDGIWHKPVTM